MDEPMRKSGQYPNVAIEAGSDPREVMEKYSEDTREQLEQDITVFVTWFDETEDGREVPKKVEADYSTVIKWLDRQAAISWDNAWKAQKDLIAEMQAECDEWKAKAEYQQEILDCDCRDIRDFQNEIDSLRAERDRLADEHYRYKLQCERWEAKIAELKAERGMLQRVVQIQADSFQKLERELKEALDERAS